VPAYIVFSDKTLRAMAEARPSTPQELLAISGVGPLKLERYGDAFMEAVTAEAAGQVDLEEVAHDAAETIGLTEESPIGR
jgi:ATP-dependent DNA helicase RecQ